MLWLSKIKMYAIALGSFLLALLGTYFWAKRQGKVEGSSDQQIADIGATVNAVQEQAITHADVEVKVNDLAKPKITVTVPDPIPTNEGAQQVGKSEDGTAAGDLRDHWMRD